MSFEYIEFHNAYGEGKATFVIDLRSLPPEILVSFRISQLNLSQPIEDAITGIGNQHEADPDREPVPHIDEITFLNTVYECKASQLVKIEYVYIDPNEFCAAVLYIKITRPLEPGSEYYFEVQHLIDDNIIVGGSTYVIRSVNEVPMLRRPEFEVREEEFSDLVYFHPWLDPPPQLKKRAVPSWASIKDVIRSWRVDIDQDHVASIKYNIMNGNIHNILAIPNETAIIAKIEPTGAGRLVMELPRIILDAKNESNEDTRFKVTIDGSDSSENYDEIFTSDSIRVLSLVFDSTTYRIQIKGNTMI
jgi:hypothetical protein